MNQATEGILARNLAAIARRDPSLAERLGCAPARADVGFVATDEGVLGVQVGEGARAVALCSRRRPLEEAKRFADGIDIKSAAIFIVSGFGAGHHVRALGGRVGKTGLVMVFEPDAGLLRAVLERIDCSEWLGSMNVAIVTDPSDAAAMAGALRGLEGIVALGVSLIEHPASRARIDPSQAQVFHENLLKLIRATKLSIVTTLVQMKTTIRNQMQNLDHYVARPGIDELEGLMRGRPAVVVSAGPSLARNVGLLAQPGVRERVVIIAVQTVLRTLLDRGIRPHVVTALDFSEISARFYEGLRSEDVEGVTLVVEPKVNPAVTRAFAGAIRCVGDKHLDQLLTPSLAPRDRRGLEPGATVAHLAYYLARFMGCDPVAMIGQDLAFTDGQYYAPNAAIHRVWSVELNEFTSLEALEWQRIMRMGANLIRTSDHLGRPVFTDEQMNSYRVQFERDFARDATLGLRVYDCTEGGCGKLHAEPMELARFLERFAGEGGGGAIELPRAEIALDATRRLRRVEQHLRDVRARAWRVGELSRSTAAILGRMPAEIENPRALNPLIESVHRIREQVENLEPAYAITHLLNQTGSLNRIRADRQLQLEEGLSAIEVQRRRIERDRANVESLADCADELGLMLDDAIDSMQQAIELGVGKGARVCRDERQGGRDRSSAASNAGRNAEILGESRPDGMETHSQSPGAGCVRVAAVLALDAGVPIEGLVATMERLRCCRELDGVVILTPEPERVRSAVERSWDAARQSKASVEVVACSNEDLAEHRVSIRALRALAPECWRSGAAAMSCYDQELALRPTLRAIERLNFDSVLIVGSLWARLEPGLCDEVIARHRADPSRYRFTFTQAPPGACGAVAHGSVLKDLLNLRDGAGASSPGSLANPGCLASIGGLLSYVPAAPTTDLIAFPCCVQIAPELRDLGVDRSSPIEAGDERQDLVSQLYVQLCSGPGESQQISTRVAIEQIRDAMRSAKGRQMQCPSGRRAIGLHLVGSRLNRLDFSGDPIAHRDFFEIVREARALGVGGIHVRTNLLCDRRMIEALIEAGLDVISVDVLGERQATYLSVSGVDGYASCRRNLDYLLERRDEIRRREGWLRGPKVVARLTRCDAAYGDIETFYNRWWTLADGAAIDPLPAARFGERIAPLPLPASALERLARTTRVVLSDASLTTMAAIHQAAQEAGEHRGGDASPGVAFGSQRIEPALAGTGGGGGKQAR